MRTFFSAVKAISIISLAFFSWTYLPLYQIAYAATKQEKTVPPGSSRQSAEPSGKLEKLLEDLREKTSKAQEKAAKGADGTSEIEAIKSRKAEIEALDADLRKDFAATEKKLKDASLPKEILNRHNAFMKNYENNLTELKANIDAIEKAKTPAALKAEIAKTRTHLEKVKPGKKHVPLNPNKLPHRIVKLKERAPRLKNEQFDKDFPKQRKQKSLGTAYNNWLHEINRSDQVQMSPKPVLLAFNDTFTDVPLSISPSPVASTQQDRNSLLLLAQATRNPPSQDDLSETPEIQFTPEIKAKAQELGYKPVKIYEWVRNNIDYQPYYGSFKGAQQTLLEGSGNDFDQASLLIALLRVSQIEARYAYGTIEIPIEKVMNWVGGVKDPRIAGAILATKGIPARLIIAGGTVKSVQLEHTWVEAWINYIPSRGAVHRTGHGDTWIPLDPSYKQFTYKQGMDIYTQLGFNGEQFLQSYITDTRDVTAYQDYSQRIFNFLDANYPTATVDDLLGSSSSNLAGTIVKQEFPFLLGTLPYKVIAKATEFTEVPQSKNYTVTIQIEGNGTTGLSYVGDLNEIANKRVTVSYEPASSSDAALISQYGGNIYSVPPYLLEVKPVLKVNGAITASGDAIGMGKDQLIVINFSGPDDDRDRIENIITAGNYSAIILQSQDTPVGTPSENMAALIENSKRVDSTEITLDDLLGQLLYSIGVSYFTTLSFESNIFAKTLQLINLRQPSEAMVTQEVNVDYLFNMPRTITVGGVNIDVDRNVNAVYSLSQDKEREKAFMILSGISSSVSENKILEAFFGVPSLSAVRLLKLASEQGVPIYTISSSNLNELLPQLQIGSDVKTDIVNAVNAGKNVMVSKTNISYDQWIGTGYIVLDPVTGAGSFMISGALGGAHTSKAPIADPNFKVTWLDSMIFKIVRNNIIGCAKNLSYKTAYVFGCKNPDDPNTDCHESIDCSGLTSYCYTKAGITLLGNGTSEFPYRNAQRQYDYSVATENPEPADLVFFRGSYDKNCDGTRSPDDGVTHVGLYVGAGYWMIDANVGANRDFDGVDYAEYNPFLVKFPTNCATFTWLNEQHTQCRCRGDGGLVPGGAMFKSFVGYGKILP